MIKLIKPNNKRTACLFGQIRVHTGLPKHREKLGSDPHLDIKVKSVPSKDLMISFKKKSSVSSLNHA